MRRAKFAHPTEPVVLRIVVAKVAIAGVGNVLPVAVAAVKEAGEEARIALLLPALQVIRTRLLVHGW